MNFQKLPGIYKITNKLNGKSYIGQSKNVNSRIKAHCRKSRVLVINKAIQKYGVDNFEFEVVLYCDIDSLDYYEKRLISHYNTISPNGYNIDVGGKDRRIAESTKKKLSNSMKGRYVGENNPFYGKTHNEQSIKLISIANKGKTISDEHRKIISESSSKRRGVDSYWYGKEPPFKGRSHSENSRKLIGDAERGELNHGSVPVLINGVRYSCQEEAARSMGVSRNTIKYRILSNSQKFSGYSYA